MPPDGRRLRVRLRHRREEDFQEEKVAMENRKDKLETGEISLYLSCLIPCWEPHFMCWMIIGREEIRDGKQEEVEGI